MLSRMTGFEQSRLLHRRLGERWRELRDTWDDPRQAAMVHQTVPFTDQIFDALDRDPIGTLLSMAWTLCSSIPYNIDSRIECVRAWSPFIYLVMMLRRFSNNTGQQQPAPFDLEEMWTSDKAFVADASKREKTTTTTTATTTTITTEKTMDQRFLGQLNDTPFGSYERVDVDGEWTISDGKQYRYVPIAAQVRDRKRYLYNYERYASLERLRLQAERVLGHPVRAWLFAADDEARTMTWQIQKSTLVWMLYHHLAAMCAVDRQRTVRDFLVVMDAMPLFVECGLCHHHWSRDGKKEWSALNEWKRDLELSEDGGELVDIRLLRTHNRVQRNIDPGTELTEAALMALREDYLLSVRRVLGGDRTRTEQRGDVCVERHELWLDSLRRTRRHDCDASRRFAKECALKLEWDECLRRVK